MAWPWSSNLKNIYTEFILFKAYLPPQSSSIQPGAIFAKVAPLLPAACGPDGWKNKFLKNLPEHCTSVLADLFNKILDLGIVPNEWTVGIIMPLFKNKGAPTDPSN